MIINKKWQLNISVDQYKLLSSTAGVGSIVNTKLGFSIMPLSINNWPFIRRIEDELQRNPNATIKEHAKEACVDFIEDERFIEYLKQYEYLPNLKYLVAIPHLQLDERFNSVKNHSASLYRRYLLPKNIDAKGLSNDYFAIPGIVFPRWMVSQRSNMLYRYEKWRDIWKNHEPSLEGFAPPRDGEEIPRVYTNRKGEQIQEFPLLSQMPFVLICTNGHVSDVPWDKYFSAKVNKADVLKPGFDLFGYDNCSCSKNNGKGHELFYTENKNHSEGFGVLKCRKCGEVVSLEGIMNMRPKCSREKIWLGRGQQSSDFQTDISCTKSGTSKDNTMSVALVTSSSVYFADANSSLYVPKEYLVSLNQNEIAAIDWLKDRYARKLTSNPNLSREDFWTSRYDSDDDFKEGYSDARDIELTDDEVRNVKDSFLNEDADATEDEHEKAEIYRFQEYKTFSQNNSRNHPKLSFHDIALPDNLKPFITKISQVERLCLTKVQTEFFRESIPSPVMQDGKPIYPSGCKIYKSTQETHVLPANQMLGEGLFFELNRDRLSRWAKENEHHYKNRDEKLGSKVSILLNMYGAAEFYALHTLAHLVIKELEFSCGYSSESLMERIYYSDRMCGFLVYTTDGGDGGMGGLVWQGQPMMIEQILKRALIRALECASDPICWEHDENLNYAACFSCAMVSETSCEFRNLGLDRRAIVDIDSVTQSGFFKDYILQVLESSNTIKE